MFELWSVYCVDAPSYPFINLVVKSSICTYLITNNLCRERHNTIAKYLIDDLHCDPDYKSKDGWTPLNWANK